METETEVLTPRVSTNVSADISWLDRDIKRFKEIGTIIPTNQIKIYEKIRDHWVGGRTAIDMGCSIGTGANILSHMARHVWGVDVNEENINFAKHLLERPNLSFELLDVENPPTRPIAQFEIVTMIEVIEHVANYEAALATMKMFFSDKLSTIGFITIPNINNPVVKELDNKNTLHINHWAPGDFYQLLTNHFRHVVLFSNEKLDQWGSEETVDGNDTSSQIIIAKVEGAII